MHHFIPYKLPSKKRVLIMTAVTVERDAVLRGLHNNSRFDVLAAGVGSVAAAVSTVKALAAAEYGLVISIGIGGGFSGKADVGSLVVATTIVVADLGAQTANGFRSVDELGFGFGCTQLQIDPNLVERIAGALLSAKLPVCTGPVLTVSTVTGTAERSLELTTRIPDAMAEAMEGYGVGCAAFDRKVPVLEIRAISNMVGPRDRATWRVPEALNVLEAASAVLTEVLL